MEGAGPWASASSLSIEVSPATAPGAPRVRARIDAAGRFRLGPLPAGDWRVAVTADGTEIAAEVASTPSSDLEFRLPDLRVLTVQLLGDDVGEFIVYVTAADGSGMSRSTPPSGSVSFSLTDDDTRRVVATRDGDERIGVAESVRASSGPLRLELSVGLTIAGRIEGLAPGAAERVEILLTGAGVARHGSCDAGGAFRFPGLLPGRYRLTIWGEDLGGRIPAVEDLEAGTTDLVLRVE